MTKTWLSSSLREITVERNMDINRFLFATLHYERTGVSNRGMWGSKAGT